MNRKKATSIIAIILTVIMVLSLVGTILPAAAHAVDQSDIDRIQSEKDKLSSQVRDARERIELLKEEQANVLEQKIALDAENKYANEQLNLVAEEIKIYDDLIEEKADEVEEAKTREEKQLERYRSRVRSMEESGGYSILSLFLNSTSFSEFLTALDDMRCIMESDKTLEKQYIEAREETEEIKTSYEEEKALIEEKQSELKKEQEELEKQIDESLAMLDELEEEINKAVEEYEAAQAAEAAAQASILQMIRAYNEQKRQEAEANKPQPVPPSGGGNEGGESSGGSDPDWGNTPAEGEDGGSSDTGSGNESSGGGGGGASGGFVWPVPSSNVVTSRFGYRTDPFNGTSRFHSGIDIDGFQREGNPVVAAAEGTVIFAGSNSGYGNYVIIDHGNYTQTLYAHMSGFAVSSGNYVAQGQTVGYLGQTGRATGVHCHFEVIINGNHVDPENYFTGQTHWNC